MREAVLIFGDHEVSQVPRVLKCLDLDLLRLLVHRESACWQHGAGALAVGQENQLDSPDAVIRGTIIPVQLAE